MTRFSLRALGFLGGVTLLSSCTLMLPRQAPPVQSEPAAPLVTERIGTEPALEPVVESVLEPAAPPAPATSDGPVRTAIVLSDAIPEYAQIAAEVVRRGTDQVTVYYVSAQPGHDNGVVAEIERANPDRIIAVGLPAAIVARRIPAKPMVFCQAYNYQDHDLVSPMSKGVHLLPPFDLQLEAWRAAAPNLRHIGAITGPGHDERIAEMRRAATAFDVVLAVRTVHSDQEALLAFEELAPSIEGLWLLPDNRILSPDVVKEILWYSARHGTQIATFSERMLEHGALLSSTSVPGDVVDRILARFDDVEDDGRLRGPGVLGLTAAQTTVNHRLAARLGLKLPERLAQSR